MALGPYVAALMETLGKKTRRTPPAPLSARASGQKLAPEFGGMVEAGSKTAISWR